MTMAKDEPQASVERGFGVTDGDGGAAEIISGSVEKSIHEIRSTENISSEPDASMVLPNQLTIFFGGSVTVFNGLPAEKVQEILGIAAKAMETKNTMSISPVPSPVLNRAPSFSSTSNVASPATQSFSAQTIPFCRSAADLPIARRHSLQRFLEKRRDRLVNKNPYPVSDIKKTDVPIGNTFIKEEFPTA